MEQQMGFGRTLFANQEFSIELKFQLSRSGFILGIQEDNEIGQGAGEPYEVTKNRPALLLGARYLLAGDHRYRQTYLPFEICPIDETLEGWDGTERIIPTEELVLRQQFMTGRVT